MNSHPQQTIKLAIDSRTGELIPAEDLLKLDEAEFSSLRRIALTARIERKRGGNSKPFQCAICKQPVFLARYKKEFTNRWFVHDGKATYCPWHEGNRLSPEQIKALIYRGQQEGARYQEMKNFLARWLETNHLVSKISKEQTTFSEVVKGEWRRPDVKCQYGEKKLVFEIQLSYTFLTEVIARDEFYRREKIFIIWVFATFELNRAVVMDEAFFNRRNLFVLDTAAMDESLNRGKLVFSGYRQVPKLINDEICDVWEPEFVELENISFPSDTYRPYFFDYEAERKSAEEKRVEILNNRLLEISAEGIQRYIDAALRYYENDYADSMKRELLSEASALAKNQSKPHRFDALQDERFYGWHSVLPVLLSIKLNRPIGYNKKLSAYQVIEAGLRHSHLDVGKNAYAILYLWAYKEYKPAISEKNRDWIRMKAEEIKASIDSGDDSFRRFTGFDNAIILLFPEMKKYLVSLFGKIKN